MSAPAHKNTKHPAGQSRYQQWWLEYNTLNGCPPAHVVGEAAYKQGWLDGVAADQQRPTREEEYRRGWENAIKDYEERQKAYWAATGGYGA